MRKRFIFYFYTFIIFVGGIQEVVEGKDENREPKPKRPRMKKKKSTQDFLKGGILSVLKDSDTDSDSKPSKYSNQSASGEDSDEEEVLKLNIKPTRSGRMPKIRQQVTNLPLDHVPEPKKKAGKVGRPKKEVPKKEENVNIEPGSVMIVSSIGENGTNF